MDKLAGRERFRSGLRDDARDQGLVAESARAAERVFDQRRGETTGEVFLLGGDD
jgi:hypothetical protein